MIRERVIPVLWLWLACVLIGVALAASIHAEPTVDPAVDFVARFGADVCLALDVSPTVAGVQRVLEAVYSTGLSAFDSGRVVGEAVTGICPGHRALLREFVAVFSGRVA